MTLRILGFSLFSFMLGAALFATFTTRVSNANVQGNLPSDRTADRSAIRAHIESIFQAFINKDAASLRATHAENWLGYLDSSGTMIKGIEGYMDWNQVDPKSPYGMKSYKFREFDMIFKGDAAFVCFVADVESNWPGRSPHRVLQICDFYTKNNGNWIQNGSDTALHQESLEEQMALPRSIGDDMKKRLLDAREAVWCDRRCGTRRMKRTHTARAARPEIAAPATATPSMVTGCEKRIATNAPAHSPI